MKKRQGRKLILNIVGTCELIKVPANQLMCVTQVKRDFHLYDEICWTIEKASNKLTMLFSNKLESYKTFLKKLFKQMVPCDQYSTLVPIPNHTKNLLLHKIVRRKFECFFKFF